MPIGSPIQTAAVGMSDRAIARRLIGLGVGLGYSPARILTWLQRERNLYYMPSVMKRDIREIMGKVYGRDRLVRYPQERIPSKHVMAEIPMLTMTKYQYRVEIPVRDAEGNQVGSISRMLSTDERLTKAQALFEFMQRDGPDAEDFSPPRTEEEAEGADWGAARVHDVYHHEGWGY